MKLIYQTFLTMSFLHYFNMLENDQKDHIVGYFMGCVMTTLFMDGKITMEEQLALLHKSNK